MSKATIEITADVARYQAELAKIPGMTDKAAARAALKMQQRMSRASDAAAKEVARAQKAAAGATSGVGRFQQGAELLERMRAALGPLGDALGDVTGGADDLGTALDGFSGKQIAAAAGAVVVAAALIKVGSAVMDVITNLQEYEDQIQRLQESGDLTAGQVEGLREASAAVETLKEGFGSLAIIIAADVAPVIEDFARGFVALKGFATGGFEGMTQAAQKFNARAREIKQEQDKAREETGKAEEKATKSHEKRADRRVAAVDRVQQAESELQGLITGALLQEADARERIALQYQQQIDQVNTLIQQHPTLAGQARELVELYQTQRDAAIAVFDTEARNKEAEKRKAAHEQQLKEIKQIDDAYAAQQAAMMQAKQETINATLESASSVAGSIHSALDSVIAMMDTSTASGKKAARQMAATQKALAIFQIGINMATSISQALAQGGPVAGAAMAAAVVAAFAGIMAEVQRPIPQFHTGRFGAASGMLGDESMTGGVVTVSPEVVIPPDLVSRSGGADGVRSRLEGDRPMIVQAVIDLTDERIVLPLSRALSARERGRLGIPLGRTA